MRYTPSVFVSQLGQFTDANSPYYYLLSMILFMAIAITVIKLTAIMTTKNVSCTIPDIFSAYVLTRRFSIFFKLGRNRKAPPTMTHITYEANIMAKRAAAVLGDLFL